MPRHLRLEKLSSKQEKFYTCPSHFSYTNVVANHMQYISFIKAWKRENSRWECVLFGGEH